MARVLVVEDQKRLAASLRKGLEEEGYEVVSSFTGEDGYYAATTQSFDALVLDLMLPGRDGWATGNCVCEPAIWKWICWHAGSCGRDLRLIKAKESSSCWSTSCGKKQSVTRDMISRDVRKEADGVWTNVIDVCVNVRSTGGEISMESCPENGTTMTVSFPQPPVSNGATTQPQGNR